MTPTEATTVVVNEGKSIEKGNKAHAEKTLRAVDSKLESLNTEIGKIIIFAPHSSAAFDVKCSLCESSYNQFENWQTTAFLHLTIGLFLYLQNALICTKKMQLG